MADASESFGPNEAANVPTEETYARWARSFGIVDGVVPSTSSYDPPDLRVSANGSSLVTINAGEANVAGVWYRNSLPLTRPVPVNGLSTSRLDAVVLRMDNVLNEVSVKYLRGAGPSLPALAQSFGVQWDLLLATVTVPAGASVVASSAVAERRQFIAPGITAQNTGVSHNPGVPGQLQTRPGRLLQAQPDGSWNDIYPEPDPRFVRFEYTDNIRDYNAGTGSGFADGAYAKFANNVIQLRGVVEVISGTAPANVVITRLPAGFRPSSSRVFCVWSSAGPARITVNGEDNATDSGKVRIVAGLAVNGWISLDGINYWASA